VPRAVDRVGAALDDVAEYDLIDAGGIDLRALQRGFSRRDSQVYRSDVAQRAAEVAERVRAPLTITMSGRSDEAMRCFPLPRLTAGVRLRVHYGVGFDLDEQSRVDEPHYLEERRRGSDMRK